MAKRAAMLTWQAKRTQTLSLSGPLNKYLTEQLGYGYHEFQSSLVAIDDLRELCRQTENKEATVKNLKRYFAILTAIEKRFPISEKSVCLTFEWSDTIPTSSSSFLSFVSSDMEKSFNINAEKNAILFNLSLALANYAASLDRTTPDGLKYASASLQEAAGTLELLAESLPLAPSSSLDLSSEFLNALTSAMLAQAQECYYEKAIGDQMKNANLSKLASQISSFYGRSAALMQTQKLYNHPRGVELYATFEMKRRFFSAAAHYRYSLHCKSQIQYGAEVAHLKIASGVLGDPNTKPLMKLLNAELADRISSTEAHINLALNAAVRDNDKIYFQVVPRDAPTELPTHTLVKPKRIEDLGVVPAEDTLSLPLSLIVPLSIQLSLTSYRERQDQICRIILDMIEDNNNVVKCSLSSMGLPGALLVHHTMEDIPSDMRQKIESMRENGGLEFLLSSFLEIGNLAAKCKRMCEDAIAVLNAEEKEDQDQRAKYGREWECTPSHLLTDKLREEGAKLRGNLEISQKSDSFVQGKFKDSEKMLAILNNPSLTMKDLLPSPSTPSPSHISSHPTAERLKTLLEQLDYLVSARTRIHADLKKKMEDDDITKQLMDGGQGQEVIVQNALKAFEDLKGQLEKNVSQQAQALLLISQANEDFVAFLASQNIDRQEERTRVIQRIEMALMSFAELVGHVSEGKRFYRELFSLAETFKRKCDDFQLARGLERENLTAAIQQRLSNPSARNDRPPPYPASSSSSSSNPFVTYPSSSPSAPPVYMGMPVHNPYSPAPSSSSPSSYPPPGYPYRYPQGR